jgi:predicted transcriptional regulator
MVERDTSERLFRARVEYLVEDTSVAETARFYGRTPRTVRRWIAGETTPSRSVRTSVSRRALNRGAAPALQVRVGGRFDARGTIARSGSQRAIEVANLYTRRRREAEIRLARATGNRTRLAAARALPTRLDRRTADNLALARERLMEQGSDAPTNRGEELARELTDEEADALGEEYFYDLAYGNWEDWREAYEEMAGYGRNE